MGNGRRQSALLVEIMIAVLFFALASTVILEAYGAARKESSFAEVANASMMEVQNLAEKLYAADDPAALLAEHGLEEEDGVWRAERGRYVLTAEIEEEAFAAGVLRTVRIGAWLNGEALLEVPCARYIPREVSA